VAIPQSCGRLLVGQSHAERENAGQNTPIPRGDSAPPFLKGDTGGFMVMPILPRTARNDTPQPVLTEGLLLATGPE
jgi:hypothetical protein